MITRWCKVLLPAPNFVRIILVMCYVECVLCLQEKSAQIHAMVVRHNNRGMYNHPHNMDYINLSGTFSHIGATKAAEGQLIQKHPLDLCGRFKIRNEFRYGWIAFLRPDYIPNAPKRCRSIFHMIKQAIKQGVIAMIIDTDGLPEIKEELSRTNLKRISFTLPLVILHSGDGTKLFSFLKSSDEIHLRINPLKPDERHNEVILFLTCFLLVGIVCLAVIIKIKWRKRNKKNNISEQAKTAVSQMQCRQYKDKKTERQLKMKVKMKKKLRKRSVNDFSHSKGKTNKADENSDDEDEDSPEISIFSGNKEMCVICLEEYKPQQDIRILPCNHEFHKTCVDPWLLQHCTCPLCNYNIVECRYDSTQFENESLIHDQTLLYSLRDSRTEVNISRADPSCSFSSGLQSYRQIIPSAQYSNRHPSSRNVPKIPLHKLHSNHHNYSSNEPNSSNSSNNVAIYDVPKSSIGLRRYLRNANTPCNIHSVPVFSRRTNRVPVNYFIEPNVSLAQGSSSEDAERHIVKVEVQHHACNAHLTNRNDAMFSTEKSTFHSATNNPLPVEPSDTSQLEPFLNALTALKANQRSSASDESSLSVFSFKARPPSSMRDSLNSINQ